jgi:predicted small secreted protein
MTRTPRPLLPALTIMAALAATAACNTREGPAERAGRGLDRAGERVRDAVDPPRGPAERTGRSVDRALNR